MRLFPPPLHIDNTEGFTREKDIFGRATIGNGLTNLLTSVSDPLVVAVDGQWGSGKTTFLKMWVGELRKSGFPVIYFDAFANDYAEDAFTAIASEIMSLAAEKHQQSEPKARAFLDKAVGAGKIVLRSSLKIGVKLATAGALEATDFERTSEDIAKEASELTDKHIGEILTKQREQKQTIEAFRDALAALPALLAATSENDTRAKPLIIVVDELDRCRPLFALQILERVKHFFAVSRVHFVLGTHLAQLRNSVTIAYGSNIDANIYLQKFLSLTVHLMDTGLRRHQRAIVKYIDHLMAAMEFMPKDQKTVEYVRDYFRHVAVSRDLSLRMMERVFSTLAIALAYRSEQTYSPSPIIAGLSVLKVMEPDLYVRAKAGTLQWDEVRVPLGFASPRQEAERGRLEHMMAYWRYATDTLSSNDPLHEKFGSGLVQYDLVREQIVQFVANAIMDRLEPATQ